MTVFVVGGRFSRWLYYYSSESEEEKHFGNALGRKEHFQMAQIPSIIKEKIAKAPASSFRNERRGGRAKDLLMKKLFYSSRLAKRVARLLQCDLDDVFLILEVLGRGNIILQNKK